MTSKRKVVANNPSCPGYDPSKPTTWILYVDANALYTGSMCEYMPIGGQEWIEPEEVPNILEIPEDSSIGYTLEVDLEYPKELHKTYTAYPLTPENLEVSAEEMSEYQQNLIKNLGHYTKTKKLVPNLNNKTHYILHYRALQCYLKLGMRITKIHRAIKYNQSPWMKSFMDDLAKSVL
jgi:hypothetical protein